MKILITGATGLVGKALAKKLYLEGHQIVVLSRGNSERVRDTMVFPVETKQWNPSDQNGLNKSGSDSLLDALIGVDVVVSLAGESIVGQRLNAEVKQRILDSRVLGTRALIDALFTLRADPKNKDRLPKVLLSASAIGYYGDRRDEIIEESAFPGEGFLSKICQAWEHEVWRAAELPIRTAVFRIGMVLSSQGGALEKMIVPFKLGLGGKLGSGKQWMSWIHLDDLTQMLSEACVNQKFSGTFNAVSPEPVTNKNFTASLARVFKKPAVFKVPIFALKIALGEIAESIASFSQRVVPKRLLEIQFQFKYSNLEKAMNDLLVRPGGIPSVSVKDSQFYMEQFIPKEPEVVFSYFSRAENLEELTPPWLNFKISRVSTSTIEEGTLIDYKLKLHGIPLKWRTRIDSWQPYYEFIDRQLKGPYARWEHKHKFEPVPGGTLITDQVVYRLPLGLLGKLVAYRKVKKDIAAIFSYRKTKIKELFNS